MTTCCVLIGWPTKNRFRNYFVSREALQIADLRREVAGGTKRQAVQWLQKKVRAVVQQFNEETTAEEKAWKNILGPIIEDQFERVAKANPNYEPTTFIMQMLNYKYDENSEQKDGKNE